MSIATEVALIIEKDPVIKAAIERGFANLTKVAREILPEIERIEGKKVNLSAVVMAVKRYAEKRKKEGKEREIKIRKIFVIDGLVLKRSGRDEFIMNWSKLKEAQQISMGIEECVAIGEKEKLQGIGDEAKKVGMVSIIFDEKVIEEPGVIEYVLKPLSWNNLNIVEIISAGKELNLFFREEDLAKAYQILSSWLKRVRD